MARMLPSLLEIVDPDRLRSELDAVAARHEGDGDAMKRALVEVLKRTLAAGRAKARERLEQGAHRGRICAQNLSYLQDTIIRALYAFTTRYVYRVSNPSTAEGLCVAAVGGYGRGTLAPGSDIDLLFLLPYKQTPWGESVVEYMLYVLWDLGHKVGHSTRSVNDCVRLAREDFTIRTALLEARYLIGDKSLFDELEKRFDAEVVKGTGNEFVEAKLAERDERHARAGESRYLVEPNVKDGKGGLRDLNTLFWIGKYLYRVKQPSDLVAAGVFTRTEFATFRKAEDFLWAVRCELHFLTGRAVDRITFDLQTEMADRLGYQGHRGLKAVERFMKHYFLIAKDVGDLTRIFCAALEEQEKKKKPGIGRFMQALRRKKKMTKGFRIEGGRLAFENDKLVEQDPVNLIRIFHLADQHLLEIHPDALRLVTRSLKYIGAELRADTEANRLFFEILTSRKDPERTLRMMNEAGVLGRFVPDFGRIVALMQFNMYHHYTADEHLLRAIGILSETEKCTEPGDHPLATELMASIKNRAVLYLAVFLHDIAKGREEDHSHAGERIAEHLCPRLGMSPSETETVAWLVRNHLVMSDVAQKRDISDTRTVRDFANIVQSPERLKLLFILTVVDIKAVGPGVWNGWKAQLLRELYFETLAVLQGGDAQLNRADRIVEAKAALEKRLSDWPRQEWNAYVARHTEAYWLSFDTDVQERHARLIAGAKDALTVAAFSEPTRDVTELTLYAEDHPGLFSRFAGACAILGMNIVDAKIFTTRDGMALDTLWVQDQHGGAIAEERRVQRLEATIRKVLAGEVLPPDLIAQRFKGESRAEAFQVAPQVYIDNNASDVYTVIEVNGLDRPGLLHALTRALFHLGLTIASAHVATYGERAVDVFYVKDVIGQKVTNANKEKAIERHLLDALADPVNRARPAGARRRDTKAAAV
ncbi:MAG TPA: [protein-PII] uridylyltransferase [Parvibaculum sp.]|uniref:[protein-PII] uridylyltransferase n=1 Tax=Parvibaculum sp. TaxID=2024848 RepID=UPI002C91598E|nr:[protein-PII] uridylyltransferase [Parvibaculum sp.]HMM14062.1 [protein-PII] uridylyltransferase [Parvibaculum sp.]